MIGMFRLSLAFGAIGRFVQKVIGFREIVNDVALRAFFGLELRLGLQIGAIGISEVIVRGNAEWLFQPMVSDINRSRRSSQQTLIPALTR